MQTKYRVGGGIKYHTPIKLRKNKGFTLVELLAVIVVLAVIAMIAVPTVLNIIEKARIGAVKASALNYIKAIDTYIVSSELDKDAIMLSKNTKYNVTTNTIVNNKNYPMMNDLVSIKGSKPTGSKDYVTLDNNYLVVEGQLNINGYVVIIKNGEISSITKGEKIEIESMTLNYLNQTMEKGSSFKLLPIFTPSDASNQDVTYASSDENIVTVDDKGNVTAKNIGNAKIIVTSEDDTSKKAECNITVIVTATGVEVTPATSEIKIGEQVQLTGKLIPSDTTSNALNWESSNVNVASVDSNGLVTGISKGEVTITATTVNGLKATSKITVKEILAETITLNETSKTIENSSTLQLSAIIKPDNTTNKNITWSSSNESVATVSNTGLVTGKGVGTAVITVKTSNGKSATANITVTLQSLSNVVKVGDYVAYDAGEWTSTSTKPTKQGVFGGYTAGQNKANSVKWCYESKFTAELKGWRVLKIDKETKTVTLVHAGTPECYYHAKGYANNSIENLNNRAMNTYLNSMYATSAHMMTYSEVNSIVVSTGSLTNDLTYIGPSGTINASNHYWLSSTDGTSLWSVFYSGVFNPNDDASLGIRPVIVLKAGIKTMGKGTDVVGQEAWTLVAP